MPQEQRELHDHEDTAGDEREPRLGQGPAAQVALHEHLVRAVRGGREDRAADDRGPEGVVTPQVPREVEGHQLAGLRRRRPCLLPAARNGGEQRGRRRERAGQVYDELHDVHPDHRGHAAQPGVGQRDHGHQQDGGNHNRRLRRIREPKRGRGRGEHRREHQRSGKETQSIGEVARDQEDRRRAPAERASDPCAQQLVRGEQILAEVRRQQDECHQHAPGEIAEGELEERQVPPERIARDADHGDRARLRRDDGACDRPPRHAPPGQIVVAQGRSPAREPASTP